MSNSSTQNICSEIGGGGNAKAKRTSGQIIFGWDRFSCSTVFLLAASFAVWGVAYFTLYEPGEVEPCH